MTTIERLHMKTIAIALLTLALTGCGSLEGKFDNIPSCSLDGKDMLVSSMYFGFGVAAKMRASDAAAVCAPRKP